MIKSVLHPLFDRLGTFAAGTAATYGATHDEANIIATAFIIIAGLVTDMLLAARRRKRGD